MAISKVRARPRTWEATSTGGRSSGSRRWRPPHHQGRAGPPSAPSGGANHRLYPASAPGSRTKSFMWS